MSGGKCPDTLCNTCKWGNIVTNYGQVEQNSRTNINMLTIHPLLLTELLLELLNLLRQTLFHVRSFLLFGNYLRPQEQDLALQLLGAVLLSNLSRYDVFAILQQQQLHLLRRKERIDNIFVYSSQTDRLQYDYTKQ